MRRARLQAGLTLAQVGGNELTRQAVHLIETGRARPSMKSIGIIARRLRVPVAMFLVAASHDQSAVDELRDQLERLQQAHQYTEIVSVAREVLGRKGPRELEAAGRYHLGVALYHLSRPDEAIEQLDRAAQLFEEIGDPWGAAEAMDWHASSLHLKDEARALLLGQEALRRYRQLRPHRPEVESRMLEHVGAYLVRRREYEDALAYYDHALQVAGGLQDLTRLARIYHGQGRCRWSLGDQVTAIEQLTKAVVLYRVENDLRPQAARAHLPRAENDLAMMHMGRGALSMAEECLLSALDHLEEAGVEHGRSNLVLTLAELRERQGRGDEAMRLTEDAMELAGRLNETLTVAAAHRQLAELLEKRGQHEVADLHFRWATDLLRQHGMEARTEEYIAAHRAAQAARGGKSDIPAESA